MEHFLNAPVDPWKIVHMQGLTDSTTAGELLSLIKYHVGQG